MKKVLFILPSLTVGGLEKVQITIANKLVKSGYDVTVMTLGSADDLRGELDERVHFMYKPLKRHIGNRIPYIRNRFYDDGMWETRASAKQLYDYYVGGEKYDVEIAFFRGLSIKILSGSPRNRKKITTISKKSVGTLPRDEINNDFKTEIDGYRSLAWVHNDFERASGYRNNFKNMKEVFAAYASYDHVVCVSKQAAEGFKKAIGDTGNIITIYNMIPVELVNKLAFESPQRKLSNAKINIVMVGRLLDKAKGHTRLIPAIARAKREGADLFLTIVGDGPDRELIRKCIVENDAADYISMIGNQKNPYPFIKNADLLVCASYYEGFPLNVSEAIVLETPVLSTYCTGPNEILDYGKYGMIVENSEEGLYYGLKQLINNPDLLSSYKEKAKLRKELFNEDIILKQITDLF